MLVGTGFRLPQILNMNPQLCRLAGQIDWDVFDAILVSGYYREQTLRSGYIYQIYAYLRTQAGPGDAGADCATGLLLHPAIGEEIDETVVIQGHAGRLATVD